MKAFFAFFLVIAAASAAVPIKFHQPRGVIEDALAMTECIKAAVETLQESIDGILAAVDGVQAVVDHANKEIAVCMAIGDGNPSIVQQVQMAQCLVTVSGQIREEYNAAMIVVEESVVHLGEIPAVINACF